jgi:hypothetical protein
MVTFAGLIIIAFTYRDQQLLREKDDPANETIRRASFTKFKSWLFWITFSILFLYVILLRIKPNNTLSSLFFLISIYAGIIFNIIGFLWGIKFVIYFLNPDTVRSITSKEVESIAKTTEPVDSKEFIEKYFILEDKIKSIIQNFGVKPDKITKKEMRALLSIRRILDASSLQKLENITKIRSLIAKGEIDKIDKSLIKIIDEILEKLDSYSIKL